MVNDNRTLHGRLSITYMSRSRVAFGLKTTAPTLVACPRRALTCKKRKKFRFLPYNRRKNRDTVYNICKRCRRAESWTQLWTTIQLEGLQSLKTWDQRRASLLKSRRGYSIEFLQNWKKLADCNGLELLFQVFFWVPYRHVGICTYFVDLW